MKKLPEIVCLDEAGFAEQMKTVAEPVLSLARKCGRLATGAGELYYETYGQKVSLGTVVICHGFCESGRKYDEFVYYLLQAGFQVAVYDQRGHGRSFREGKADYVIHVNDFHDYVDDLHLFVNKVVKPFSKGLPLFLYAHSMGGCVGAAYLEEYRDDFQKAVLSTPMLTLKLGVCPLFLAKTFCDIRVLLGKGDEKLVFQSEFNPKKSFQNSSADSKARYEYFHEIRIKNPCYQTGPASYSWGKQAILAGRNVMRQKNIRKITIPVLVFQAGNDKRIRSSSLHKFVRGLSRGRLISYPEAKHEIFRSRNKLLMEYLSEITEFFCFSHNS